MKRRRRIVKKMKKGWWYNYNINSFCSIDEFNFSFSFFKPGMLVRITNHEHLGIKMGLLERVIPSSFSNLYSMWLVDISGTEQKFIIEHKDIAPINIGQNFCNGVSYSNGLNYSCAGSASWIPSSSSFSNSYSVSWYQIPSSPIAKTSTITTYTPPKKKS